MTILIPKISANMSDEERISLVESIFIVYPRLKRLLADIDHCRTYSKIAAEPECMFIGGLAGAGKTTTQLHYIRQFQRTRTENGWNIPALRARVPSRATDKTLVTALLRSIQDPAADKGSADRQTARLVNRMDDTGVEICHIDEFQHFADKDSAKVLKNVSDWLKNLIDESRKPFVIWGMPYADQILYEAGNEQLRRRFSIRKSLDPFGWSTKKDKDEFRGFLTLVDGQLPFATPSRLGSLTMAFRFSCATNGRIGYVMKIIRRAAELTIRRRIPKINLDILAEAYNDRLMVDYPNRDNPFTVAESNLKIIPFEEYVPEFKNSRLKTSGKQETASDVLRT
jgi:hypothetical protein